MTIFKKIQSSEEKAKIHFENWKNDETYTFSSTINIHCYESNER